MTKKIIQVRALSAAIDEAAAVAGRILLLRYGRQEYTTIGGGQGFYLFDRNDAERIVAEFNRRAVEIASDYEHQALLSKVNGQPAPASGWVTALRLTDEGLEAEVKWTPRALAAIQAKEYRYISPAFTQFEDGRVDRWINFALTNLPATDGSQALVAASQLFTLPGEPGEQTKEYVMKSVLTLLGLAVDAPESDATAKVNTLLAAHTAAEGFRARAATMLGLAADASLGALGGAVTALKKQADQVTALSSELAILNAAQEQGKRDQLIAEALADGRLSNAQQEWAKTVALDILTGYLATTPKGSIVPVQTPGNPQDRADQAVALSAIDQTVARNCGLDPAKVAENWKTHTAATA